MLSVTETQSQVVQPDFVVWDVSFNPVSAVVGEPVAISVNVHNVGDRSGIPGLTRMWIDPPSDFIDNTGRIDSTVRPTRQLNYRLPLASDAEMTMLYSWVVFDTPGSHSIWAHVDGLDMSSESDETNNVSVFDIFVEESCTGDQYEPDDSPNTSTRLQMDVPQTHTICPFNETDWLQFDVVTGADYIVETLNLGPRADTTICLYDMGGSNVVACNDDGGDGLASSLSYRATSNETIYVEVRHFSAEIQGDETYYDIQLRDGTCIDDAFEPDNELEQATLIAVDGIPRSHNFCETEDVDWHRVWLDPGIYQFHTSNLDSRTDTVLALYDESGFALSSNDDGGDGGSLASEVTWTVGNDAAGVYYISIQQFDSQSSGQNTNYDVTATNITNQ